MIVHIFIISYCPVVFALKQLRLYLLVYLFIYLWMAVLGLRFCARAFSTCGKWGPLFIAVRGLLTIAASLVVEHRLQTRRLSSCGARAQSLRGMWDPPRPGLEPVSPALAGRLSTTAPPGKPPKTIKTLNSFNKKMIICIESLLEHFHEIIVQLYTYQSGLVLKEYFVKLALFKKI